MRAGSIRELYYDVYCEWKNNTENRIFVDGWLGILPLRVLLLAFVRPGRQCVCVCVCARVRASRMS